MDVISDRYTILRAIFYFPKNSKYRSKLFTHTTKETTLNPLQETPSLQGTLGKCLLNIKVTNLKVRRLNISHAYWLNLCFVVSTAGFKLTIWINVFSKDEKLLHDRFSR
jgi:hypothetical protein